MVEFAVRKLSDSLAELIGAEEELGALSNGWASETSAEKRTEWAKVGRAATAEIIEEYNQIWRSEQDRLFAKVRSALGDNSQRLD